MKKVLLLLLVLALFSCTHEQNTEEFNSLISSYYENCANKDSCIIDLGKEMPFEWSRMYVLDGEYSEMQSNEVADYVGVNNYWGNKNGYSNRSILFIKDKKVVYEVLTPYGVEGGIDPAPMFMEFYDRNIFPKYFSKEDAKFKVYKRKSIEGYNLEYLPKDSIESN